MQHKRIITPPSSPPPHNSNSNNHQQQRPITRTKPPSHRNHRNNNNNNNSSNSSSTFFHQELSWRRSGKTAQQQQQQQHTRAPQENQIWKNCELALEKLCSTSHHEPQHGNVCHHQSEENNEQHNEQLIDSTDCIFHMLHSQVQQLVQQVSYPDATLHSTQIFRLFSRIESIFHHFSLFQHLTTNNNKNDDDSSDPNDDQSGGENGENDGNDGNGGGDDDDSDLSLINFTSHFCQLIILLITKQKMNIHTPKGSEAMTRLLYFLVQLSQLMLDGQKRSKTTKRTLTTTTMTHDMMKHNGGNKKHSSSVLIECLKCMNFVVSMPNVQFLSCFTTVSDQSRPSEHLLSTGIIQLVQSIETSVETRKLSQSNDKTKLYLLHLIEKGALFDMVELVKWQKTDERKRRHVCDFSALFDYLSRNICELTDRLIWSCMMNAKMMSHGANGAPSNQPIYLEKHVSSILKSLVLLVKHCPKVHVPHISKLVSQLKKLMCYGTRYMPRVGLSVELQQREQQQQQKYVSSSTSSAATANSNHQQQCEDLMNMSGLSSSSDASDSEQSAGGRSAMRVRLQSMQLLSEMAKSDFKSIFGEFKHLFPTASSPSSSDMTSGADSDQISLCTVMLHDASSRCRSAAAQTITQMLENSKLYLAQADDMQTRSSFVSFSRQLASILFELHRSLLFGLDTEKSTSTLICILKCLSTLIQNTSYEKLSMRFMTQVSNKMLWFIENSSDRSIQNLAFHCLSCLFNTARPLKELEQYLNQEAHGGPLDTLLSYLDSPYSTTIRTECAQVFLAICSNYPNCINRRWSQLCQIIQRGLGHSDQTLRLILVQIVNNYTAPYADIPMVVSATSLAHSAEGIIITDLTKPIPHDIWIQIIDDIISIALNDEFQSIRASACQIYANMTEQHYVQLLNERRNDMIDRLIDAIHDEAPTVKSASCRAIGSIVLFNVIRRDIHQLNQMFLILKPLVTESSVLNVRVRSSWAIANLCDTIRQSSWCSQITCGNDDDDDNDDDDEGYSLLMDIIRTLFSCCRDNDKIMCNVARAFGNICMCAPQCILRSQISGASVEDLILAELVSCIESKDRTVKPRWNACYAIGGLLSNRHVSTSENLAFECLCRVIRHETNFKVRIQAAVALSMALDFGYSCTSVLRTLLVTFDSKGDYAFKEYKYIKTLNEQIQKGICHLMSVTDVNRYGSELVHVLRDGYEETLATCVIDAINQPEFYDSELQALKNALTLLELQCASSVLNPESVTKASAMLRKRLLLEQEIQNNIQQS